MSKLIGLRDCDICGQAKGYNEIQQLRETLATEEIQEVCYDCIAESDVIFYAPLRHIFKQLKQQKEEK